MLTMKPAWMTLRGFKAQRSQEVWCGRHPIWMTTIMEWKMEIRLIMLPYVASSARLHHLLNKSQMLMGMEGLLLQWSKKVLLGVLSKSDNTEEAFVLLVNMWTCSHIFVTFHPLSSEQRVLIVESPSTLAVQSFQVCWGSLCCSQIQAV